MPTLLAYALLFTAVGAFFIFIHLTIGRLVRPMRMDAEKATIYECGEPTIGSSWVQFDLRFYVVALLFVIFDVEMAFFFPWAVVFGKANALAKTDLPADQRIAMTREIYPPEYWRIGGAERGENVPEGETPLRWKAFEQSVKDATGPLQTRSERENDVNRRKKDPTPAEQTREAAAAFGLIAFLDILVFFVVLLVGFAYLWKRGDLDWVRSIAAQKQEVSDQRSEVSAVTF
jgi:NADH-quinone oxidoreductase subunit A